MQVRPPRFSIFSGAAMGAAFLMASSSIGPGFLTQTAYFTEALWTSFGFVILVSVLLDIGAQLNTWRVLTISEMRAQDLSNKMLPGLGYLLSALVVFGGFAFNIGNIAGCGLGVNVLTGMDFRTGAIISGIIALLLFWMKETGKMLDLVAPFLGFLMIGLSIYIAIQAGPPLELVARHTIMPQTISTTAIVTIVGGTVGGYITFSGAHRLLDAGIRGENCRKRTDRSAISGILISTLMRFILFLAVVGVVSAGVNLDPQNPAATVFRSAAGQTGYIFFGIVIWSAAITSVLGAAYTSVSFFKTFHPWFEKNEKLCISVFIIISTLVFVLVGRPRQLLILAGALNGLILPLALSVILIAATKRRFLKGYRHPIWMQAAGWLVVIAMGWMGVVAVKELLLAWS